MILKKISENKRATSPKILILIFSLGAVYGIGNLSFGLSLRYLGLSLGYALSLGLMLAIGTLVPPLLDNRLKLIMVSGGGNLLLAGIAKNNAVSKDMKRASVSEFNLTRGLLAALLVGITGSAMALGFEQGMPVAVLAESNGIDPLFSMMPVYLIFLTGTFLVTLALCIYLGARNGSLKNYRRSENRKTLLFNYGFGILAGLLWFSQFIFYGMGKSKMGSYTFTSWGILMALTIGFATVWGLIRGEWKGTSRHPSPGTRPGAG